MYADALQTSLVPRPKEEEKPMDKTIASGNLRFHCTSFYSFCSNSSLISSARLRAQGAEVKALRLAS